MNPGADKQALRQRYRARRQALSERERVTAACEVADLLAASPLWSAGHIGLYCASDGELDTGEIVRRVRADTPVRQLYLPRITAQEMQFAPWESGDPLRANRFDIPEPTTAVVTTSTLDLVLLPTVAWSRTGVRLGMGAGYYDRCLGAVPPGLRPLCVGLAFACQRCDELPADHWDVPLDGVLTESGLRGFSPRLRELSGDG